MSYDLHLDFETRTVLGDLPSAIRGAISAALIDACDDPIAATQPHGEVDDGIMRDLVVGGVIVVVYLGHATKVMSVFQITALT
jgi:hypothetical protein